jgi:hypothetical protein
MSVCGVDSYCHTHLFKHLTAYFTRDEEGKLEWPSFYTDYIREHYERKAITGVQRNRNRAIQNMPEEEQLKYNFGKSIEKAAKDAKTEITNRLRRMWREPLDSGETPSGLLDVIRDTCRTRDAFLRARTSVEKRYSLKEKEDKGDELQENIKMKTNKNLDAMSAYFFPNYWLTFALFASPAPDNQKQLSIFKPTTTAILQKAMVSTSDGRTMNRNSRASIRKGSDKPPPFPKGPPRNAGKQSNNAVNVTHTVNLTGGSLVDNTKEGILTRNLEVLKGAGKNQDGTFIFQEKITTCTLRLSRLLMSKLSGNDKHFLSMTDDDEDADSEYSEA